MVPITNRYAIFLVLSCAFPLLWLSAPATANEPQEKQVADFVKSLRAAMDLIGKNHFTPASNAQMISWAVRGLYQELKQSLPADIAKRLDKLDKADAKERERLLIDARRRLGPRKELDQQKDFEICMRAIFAGLEPGAKPEERSRWITREELDQRPQVWRIRGYGVGLELEPDPASNMLRVVTPIYNSPAYKAGIRAGDIITHIRIDTDPRGRPLTETDNAGEPFPVSQTISTKGMTVREATRWIVGKHGTRVWLTVIPAKAK